MEKLTLMWSKITQVASMFHFPVDFIDIAIVALLFYAILSLAHSKTASQIVKVAVVLLFLTYLSSLLGLNALNYVVSKALEIGLIALVVVFQPELRRLLERLDQGNLRSFIAPKQESTETEKTVGSVVEACKVMSKQKVGALIVFERHQPLNEYFGTGTMIDATVSEELLKNLFFPKASLHDGAVVISNNRICAAGCVLPLTQDEKLSRDLGTRHRAAIGVTEHSDAIVVVVSEETGVISCMMPGARKRFLTPETLQKLLETELEVDSSVLKLGRFRTWLLSKLDQKKEDSDDKE